MLRVMRQPAAGLRPDLREGFLALPALLQSLPVPPDVKSLIASYQFEGDYINFFVNMQGGVAPVACDAGVPQFTPQQSLAQMHFENRRAALFNAAVSQNSPAAAFLQTILQQPQFMVTVDQSTPVLIPFIGDPSALVAPAPSASVAPVAAGSAASAGSAAIGAAPAAGAAASVSTASGNGRSIGGLILWSLLALLLLGGSIFGYFKTLYPWPFVDEPLIAEEVAATAAEAADPAEAAEAAESQPSASEASEDSKTSEISENNESTALDQELATLSDQTDKRLDQLYTDAGQREAQGALDSADLLASLHASDQVSAILAAQHAQQEPEKEVPAAVESQTPQAAAELQSTLPKCDTMQDKMPMLFLALDGSGSMGVKMAEGSEKRRDAALKATDVLLERIDKNVDIRAYAIKGCPTAKDLGLFKNGDRAQLRTVLASMYDVNGSVSSSPFTPLNTAVQLIGEAAPADVESTAIVISDGIDTCYVKGRVPLCDLAKQIHAKKPKLQIHVIYVGRKSDLKRVECVAKSTNGQIFDPNSAAQLVQNIEQASQTLVKVCQ